MRELSGQKKKEIRAVADAISDSVMAVEMAARERQARRVEAKARGK